MKQVFYFFILLLYSAVSFAQIPAGFNYQAVLRDVSGGIMANTQVQLTLDILQGDANGTIIYTENRDIETNALGLINLEVGSIDPESFEKINWTNDPFFIAVTVNNELLGTSQLLSVPFAMQAQSVVNDQVNDADADVTNEIQDISIDGNQLSISKGSTITLPGGSGELLLAISGHNLSIVGGNSITIPDQYIDADADPANELNDIFEFSVETIGVNSYEIPFVIRNTALVYVNGKVIKSSQWEGKGTNTITLQIDPIKYDNITILN